MELISAPIDFFGLNYYRPHYVRAGDWSDLRLGESPIRDYPGFVNYLAPELARTVMGWPIVPESMRELLIRLHGESGGLPIYITENGCGADDYLTPAGHGRGPGADRSTSTATSSRRSTRSPTASTSPATSTGR